MPCVTKFASSSLSSLLLQTSLSVPYSSLSRTCTGTPWWRCVCLSLPLLCLCSLSPCATRSWFWGWRAYGCCRALAKRTGTCVGSPGWWWSWWPCSWSAGHPFTSSSWSRRLWTCLKPLPSWLPTSSALLWATQTAVSTRSSMPFWMRTSNVALKTSASRPSWRERRCLEARKALAQWGRSLSPWRTQIRLASQYD